MFNSLKGKTCIVTGGSKGIGCGIAKVFASKGVNVAIAARGEEAGNAVVNEIKAAGGNAAFFACDVSNFDDVKSMVDKVADHFGGIDIACLNAGMFPQSNLVDMDPSEWEQVMDVNLKSSFLGVKALIPHFEKAQKGRIILTSSITGVVTGYAGWSHYGASKAGQLGFMKSACLELAKSKVTINAVLPGNIMTEGLEGLGQDYLDEMAASIPLKCLGSVEDIAHAALFFATDEAAYITGQTIIVDGGQILPEALDAML